MAYPEDNDLQWSIDSLVSQIAVLDEHMIGLCSAVLSLIEVMEPIAKEVTEMNRKEDDIQDRLLRADVFVIRPEDKVG